MCNTSKTNKKEPTVWNCSLCSQTFRWHRHYLKHTEGHKNNDCHLCNEPFTTKKQNTLHMAQKHQIIITEENYKCDYCEQRFSKKSILYNHYKREHADGLEVCMQCGTFLNSEEEELLHEKKHANARRWKCKMCGDSFLRRQQYVSHVHAHEKYGCDICDVSFSTKLKVMTHNRDMHGDQRLELCHACPTCSQRFARPNLLQQHMRLHSEEKPLYCKDCNKNFRTPRGYQKHLHSSAHLENTLLEDAKKFTCDKCKKTFYKKESLIKHLHRPHSYKCEFCDFTSNLKENTKRHLALHTASRQFVCELCGLAFFTFAALNDHFVYIHSQIRQFQCNKCVQAFKTSSALKRHLQAHSDTRPHACHCGQAYKRRSHLRRHQDSIHGPTPRQNKVQRLGRDETGALVPIAEEPRRSKKDKKVNATLKPVWCSNSIETVMLGENGQVVTIQQLCDMPGSSLEERATYDAEVMQSYDLGFVTSTSAAQPHLVFTTLEPAAQGQVGDLIQSALTLKHPSHIYLQQDEVGNVMLDSNGGVAMDTNLGDSQQMLDHSAELLFSCHGADNPTLSTSMTEYQSQESVFLNICNSDLSC